MYVPYRNLPEGLTKEQRAAIVRMVTHPYADVIVPPPHAEQHALAIIHEAPVDPPLGRITKDWTMEMVIYHVQVINSFLGIRDCPYQAWVEDHPDLEIWQLEDMLRTHPLWTVPVCILFVATAHFLDSPADGAELQRSYTHRLLTSPVVTWDMVKGALQRLLRGPIYGGLDPDALAEIVAYMEAHGRDMKVFMAQPEVQATVGTAVTV